MRCCWRHEKRPALPKAAEQCNTLFYEEKQLHSFMKIEIRLKSFEMSLLQRSKQHLEILISLFDNAIEMKSNEKSSEMNVIKDMKKEKKHIYLPSRTSLFTVLRSPHVHKKARDQYHLKRYKGFHSIVFRHEKMAYEFIHALSKIHFIGVQIHIQCISGL